MIPRYRYLSTGSECRKTRIRRKDSAPVLHGALIPYPLPTFPEFGQSMIVERSNILREHNMRVARETRVGHPAAMAKELEEQSRISKRLYRRTPRGLGRER